jgi:DNA-binding beta-propeller fold protein YncE
MKSFLGSLLFCMLVVCASYSMSAKNLKTRPPATPQGKQYPYLEFLELKQFPMDGPKDRFDLSGLAMDKSGTVYTVSDKSRTHYVYKLDWKTGKITKDMDFGITGNLDMEAIDICGDDFYVANEANDGFYIVKKNQKTQKLEFDSSGVKLEKDFMSGNKGYEGIAIDCTNQIMYAAKEREPRYILTIDLKTKKVLKKWNTPETDSYDFSEAKYDNGYLYLLERSGMLIAKVDPKTEQVVAKYSYRNMEKGNGYLFGPSVYPFAEALIFTPTEIWIGFDNNGLKVTPQAGIDLGIKNRDPLVMKFKRPAGF